MRGRKPFSLVVLRHDWAVLQTIAPVDVHPSPEAASPSWRNPERFPAGALSTTIRRLLLGACSPIPCVPA